MSCEICNEYVLNVYTNFVYEIFVLRFVTLLQVSNYKNLAVA
jgi:hypothetical protein